MNKEINLLLEKNQSAAPVSVILIAEELGLNVYKAPEDEDKLSGKICKTGDSKSGYSIYVNSNDSVGRQRFTIAHEIAHFLLHREEIGDGIVENALYRSGLSTAMEIEANKLAADILMPWHLLRVELDKTRSIAKLAKKFGVSEIAMAIRLGAPS